MKTIKVGLKPKKSCDVSLALIEDDRWYLITYISERAQNIYGKECHYALNSVSDIIEDKMRRHCTDLNLTYKIEE
jgi:hypothetical protein